MKNNLCGNRRGEGLDYIMIKKCKMRIIFYLFEIFDISRDKVVNTDDFMILF